MLLFSISENFWRCEISTRQRQHHTSMNDAEYKRVKESDCKPRKVFLALCGEGSNPPRMIHSVSHFVDKKSRQEIEKTDAVSADRDRVFSQTCWILSVQRLD